MKSITGKPSKKKAIILIAIIIALAAGTGLYAYYRGSSSHTQSANDTSSSNQPSNSKKEDKPATPEQQKAGNQQKQDIINKDQEAQTTPTALGVTITAANQNGTVVNIRSLIGTVSTSGTCTLTVANGSATITKTSGIQALAESSTCQGFDIPTTSLPKGTWHATLSVVIGNAKGSAKKDIVVN